MNSAVRNQAGRIRRLASWIREAVAECNEATRRISTLAGTPDHFPVDPDRAPDTYAQFLIRAAAVLPRQPVPRQSERGDGHGASAAR